MLGVAHASVFPLLTLPSASCTVLPQLPLMLHKQKRRYGLVSGLVVRRVDKCIEMRSHHQNEKTGWKPRTNCNAGLRIQRPTLNRSREKPCQKSMLKAAATPPLLSSGLKTIDPDSIGIASQTTGAL